MQEEQQTQIGPRKLTFFMLVLKTFAGLGGGIIGATALILIFLGASSILQPVITNTLEGGISPLFMVVILIMMLVTTLLSGIMGTLFICYTERDRYTKISTTIMQVFIVNLVIFAFMVPVYITTATSNIELTLYTAGVQIILSAIASNLIMELIHDYKYALLSVYSIILGAITATALNILLYSITGNATILIFIALPVIWGSIGFFHGATPIFYYWIYQTWDTDFLLTTADLGQDYGIEEEEEELPEDVEGSKFLEK